MPFKLGLIYSVFSLLPNAYTFHTFSKISHTKIQFSKFFDALPANPRPGYRPGADFFEICYADWQGITLLNPKP